MACLGFGLASCDFLVVEVVVVVLVCHIIREEDQMEIVSLLLQTQQVLVQEELEVVVVVELAFIRAMITVMIAISHLSEVTPTIIFNNRDPATIIIIIGL